jgi:hypothetical protein
MDLKTILVALSYGKSSKLLNRCREFRQRVIVTLDSHRERCQYEKRHLRCFLELKKWGSLLLEELEEHHNTPRKIGSMYTYIYVETRNRSEDVTSILCTYLDFLSTYILNIRYICEPVRLTCCFFPYGFELGTN